MSENKGDIDYVLEALWGIRDELNQIKELLKTRRER